MRKLLIPLIATISLIILALIIIPLLVSTQALKNQVQQLVRDQTGMILDIKGDVAFSVITGFKLAADSVSLNDPSDKPLFAVDRLDFALALTPLFSGKADITGITLNKPVFTLTAGGANADTSPADQRQEMSEQQGTSDEIDLSALAIRKLSIRDGMLVRQDGEDINTTLISGLDMDLSIPNFAGAGTIDGSLAFQNKTHSFSGTLANMADAINGRPARLTLDLESDVYKARIIGSLAHKATTLFTANYALNAGNLTQLLAWQGISPSPLDARQLHLDGSLMVGKEEARLPALSIKIDNQTIDAAARIFYASHLERPLMRVAVDAKNLDLNAILPKAAATQADKDSSTGSSQQDAKNAEDDTPPDLSALTSFDATLDLRSNRITLKDHQIHNFKLLAQLLDGKLKSRISTANLAKGTLVADLDGDMADLLWTGSVRADQLDVSALAKMAGQNSPLTGTLSSNINFAAKGLSAEEFSRNGNIAGTVNLAKGRITSPALQSAVAGRETGSLENINATVTLEGLAKPANINGSLRWNAETIRFASTLGLAEALAGQAIPASATLSSKPVNLGLSGRFDSANISLDGSKLSLSIPSSRTLLAWLGQATSAGTPDMPVSLTSNLAFSSQKTSLSNLALQMGQSKGQGAVTVTTGSIPSINANIAFDRLDVTPFMGDGSAQGGSTGAKRNARQAGWDTSPIDFSGLKTINADIALSTRSLIARDIKTGPVNIKSTIKGGRLTAELTQLSLYKGAGTGKVTVNAQQNPAQMAAKFDLASMNMRPFLTDATGLKALSGTGGVSIDLTTRGKSQAEIIGNLGGNSRVEIKNGQINGINIPQMLRSLQGNILEGWSSSESQSTDFSALTASFAITNGIATNTDLSMLSPLLRLSGAGTIDLPRQQINYKATPKLIKKLKGQGGPVDANGVPIPIIIKGKLSAPRIYPDIPGILENPDAILNSLKNLGSGGETAAKGLNKINKTVTKQLEKQSKKLGVDLNKLIAPKDSTDQGKQQNLEQQLFKGITKGLFGN